MQSTKNSFPTYNLYLNHTLREKKMIVGRYVCITLLFNIMGDAV